MKITAVEFAVEQLQQLIPFGHQLAIRIILEQAKEMEKQQIENAFNNGYYQETIGYNASEEYYNKTFNNK